MKGINTSAGANWTNEKSHRRMAIGRVAYSAYKCRFSLNSSSTITELENCNILATKNDPPASNSAATLSVLIYAITPGIRCATVNSPNPLNSKPKMPSQTSHLDTFVMQLHPLIRSYLAENLSMHDESATYRQQTHALLIAIYFQQFEPNQLAWQPDTDWLGCCTKPIGKEMRQHFYSWATLKLWCWIARIKGSREGNNKLTFGLSGSLSANEWPKKSWKQAMDYLPLKILALGA